MDIEENVPLSGLTTFRTGGTARFVVSAYTEDEVRAALVLAATEELPIIPIGEGSNLCVPDEGVSAVFLRVRTDDVHVVPDGARALVTVGAGLSWDTLVRRMVTEGWWGLENLSGIPGTVGASVVQNIGAYGAAVGESVVSVDLLDLRTGESKTFARDECAFGYRTSIFKKEPDRYLVVRVTFTLSKDAAPNLSYRDLKNRFENESAPALQDIRDAVLTIRKGKFPPLSEYGTAGSFFLNPIVSSEEARALRARYPEMPLFDLPEGGTKAPLAWLFDRALSLKGMREGKAFLWDKQPLVIAAESGATSADVYALAQKVAQILYEKTGIAIIPEVRLFGAEKKIIARK